MCNVKRVILQWLFSFFKAVGLKVVMPILIVSITPTLPIETMISYTVTSRQSVVYHTAHNREVKMKKKP